MSFDVQISQCPTFLIVIKQESMFKHLTYVLNESSILKDVKQVHNSLETAGTKHRSQVTVHCFTNTESILNIHNS